MPVYIDHYPSPIGDLALVSDGTFLTDVIFNGNEVIFQGTFSQDPCPVLKETRRWLDLYFQGIEPDFMPPIRLIGSDFQKKVWNILREIPYGHTLTYGEIAKRIAREEGKAKMSAQAVGGAVGRNPIGILIPCHRVVGANGNLTGFGGGLDKKTSLMKLEGFDMSSFHMPETAGKAKGKPSKPRGNQFIRTEWLLGEEGMTRLKNAHVAVFGVGGVGGYVVEALVRSGVGHLDLIDNDDVAFSNLNRQIIATHRTLGRKKVDVAKERCLDINPDVKISTFTTFVLPETADQFDFHSYDYVIDCIDTVTAKIDLILRCQKAGTPIICSMGTGNKLDPTKLVVTDIYSTTMDRLAKVMRSELKKRGVKKLKVVYSPEKPIKPLGQEDSSVSSNKRSTPASNAFVPPAAGLILAAEVVKDLTDGCWPKEKER